MSDGCLDVNRVRCDNGLDAEIANVTTRHYLAYYGTDHVRVDSGVTYDAANVKLDMVSLAEFGRCSLALSGPTSKGMPSLSGVFQRAPLFGKTKVSIYEKGKVVQTGYSSPEQALFCAHDVARALNRRFKTRLRVQDFRVINIVAIVRANRAVNCTVLKNLLGAQCVYNDPRTVRKLFGKKGYSGAIVTSLMKCADAKRRPKMIIFATGIAVLMGCQKRSEIVELAREFFSYIDRVDAHTRERRVMISRRDAASAEMTARELLAAANDILRMYEG